jgi:hypothetical protein
MPDKFSYVSESTKEEDDIKQAIRKTRQEYKEKRKSIKQKMNDVRVKYAEHAETAGHTLAKQILESFEEDLIELQEKFVEKMSILLSKLKIAHARRGVKATVATVAISAILLGSYELYRKYVRDYTQQCKGKKGFDKILCYRAARLKALQQRIIYLKRSMNQECNKAQNPTRCKIRIASEIEKLTKKVEKYRELI